MARAARHNTPNGHIVRHDGGRFVLPERLRCPGRTRLLYSRRFDPQRWVAVGAYCDGCGASVVATDRELADGRRAVFV